MGSDDSDNENDTGQFATQAGLDLTLRRANAEPESFMPVVVCIEGPQRGMRYSIRAPECIIGRGSKADINIADDLASRAHARIVYRNFGHPTEKPDCYIEDLESRNGTEVNGRFIKQPTPLKERDRILVGGTLLGFFLRDESEYMLEKSLYEMAAYDALTGLYNRHQFTMMLSHHYERARRYKRPLSLLIVDADNFKRVNDIHGHDVGDMALIHIGRIIDRSCRSSEVTARWGGEEFVVLLTESDEAAIQAVARRICETVATTPLTAHTATINLTVSIGGAELKPDETLEEFFRRADKHLLRAKEHGKNRVEFTEVHESGPPPAPGTT